MRLRVVRTNTRKRWRVGCTVCTSRLQQIAISCWRTCTSLCTNSTMKNRKTGATFGTVEKGLVLHVLLILGSSLWLQDSGSLIEVSSVHSCPICSVWDTNVFDISNIPHGIGGRNGLPVPIYPLRCTSRSSQFWVVSYDVLDLVRHDRSLPRIVGHMVLFLCFSFAVSSTMGSLLLDDVVRDWESIQS